MINYIEHRPEQLLNTLLKKDGFVTISELANQLGQTNRSVQYDMQKLNKMFENLNLPHIVSKKHRGICILPEDREKLKIFLNNAGKNLNFIFSADDRMAIIICENILSEHVKTVDKISDELKVSHNTCLLDIKAVKKALLTYGITMKNNAGKYEFYGNGIRFRSVLMYYISYLYPLIKSGRLPYLSDSKTQENLKKLYNIESELGISYRPGTINKIAVMLTLCEKPLSEEVSFFEGTASGKNILRLVNKYFYQYPENDCRYITIQLMGGRIKSFSGTKNQEFKYYQTCAQHLVKSFEQLIGISVENRKLLVYNLAKHLSRSIYRYRYGLVDTCELDEKIQNDSKELFKLVKIASKPLSKELNCPINDSEISLLTVYFGAHMRKNNLNIKKIDVALVVDQIDSESKCLAKQISNFFPMFNVLNIVMPQQLYDDTNSYSFLISTRLLKYEGLYVYISKQLTVDDRKHIFETYLKYRELKNLNIPEDLFTHIKKYVPNENHSAVRRELYKYFAVGNSSNLSKLLDKNNIQILSRPKGWRDALKQASDSMIKSNWISENYVNSIIMNIEIYGCYTYFDNGVYLAHAQCKNDVYRSGVSVSLIPNGVIFPEDKCVRLLIVIASTDKYEHFNVLKEAVRICNDEKKVANIISCKNTNELFLVLKKIANTDY